MSETKRLSDKTYEIIFGTDVQRGGVYLELSDRTAEPIEVMATVFYYDEIGKVVFSASKNEIPFSLMQWLMAEVSKENWPI